MLGVDCTLDPKAAAGAGWDPPKAGVAAGCAVVPNAGGDVARLLPKAGVNDCVLLAPKAGAGLALKGVDDPNEKGLGALFVVALAVNGLAALLFGGVHTFSF